MTSFHHGGRIGDALYSLYTVKKLGGGDFYLSLFQQGSWDRNMIKSLIPFIKQQTYINDCDFVQHFGGKHFAVKSLYDGFCYRAFDVDYDLHDAELDYNPEAFPEWHKRVWPGNCHIAKRYAVHFGVEWNPEDTWLTANKTKQVSVAFHMPMRRAIRPQADYIRLLTEICDAGYTVVVLAGPNDVGEWRHLATRPNLQVVQPATYVETADYINSAQLFLGGASSCNVIAEGLKKLRYVDLAEDCFNVYASGKTGRTTNYVSIDELTQAVLDVLSD